MRSFALLVLALVTHFTTAQVEEQAEMAKATAEERNGVVAEAETLRYQLDEFLRSRLTTKREKMMLGIRKANVYTNNALDYVSSYLDLRSGRGGKGGGGKGSDTIEGLDGLKVELQSAIQEVKDSELESRSELTDKLSQIKGLGATFDAARTQWDNLELELAKGDQG